MEKIAHRFQSNSKHFKNSGEVTYLISPLKDRVPSVFIPDRETKGPYDIYSIIRERTMALCKPLYVDDFIPKHAPLKSVKWQLIHSTWLLEKFILSAYISNFNVFSEKFDHLFESVVMSKKESNFSRPTLESIISYRKYVDEQMMLLLQRCDDEISDEITYYLNFILELEKLSQEEILTQIKARFYESEFDAEYWPSEQEAAIKSRSTLPREKWLEFSGGLVNVGSDGSSYSNDMEMPRHTVFLKPFAMSQRTVTNGEFLQFVEDGGYERGGLWLSEGWAQIQKSERKMPKYWVKKGSKIEQYTLTGMKTLRLNEPVSHISFYEADAYARYAGARLPSEAEWEHASESLSSIKGNFLEEGRFHPNLISHEEIRISDKLKGMFGDVWEWTTSLYQPYPGFIAAEPKLWYYTGRLEGVKRVLKGGSCLFDGTNYRRSMRFPLSISDNTFCTGLRLVTNL